MHALSDQISGVNERMSRILNQAPTVLLLLAVKNAVLVPRNANRRCDDDAFGR